ncbi:hypothetical protein SteCoe_16451 [Stentor coeruleus]|uniref:60S acidic ribosomal protein P2 n=1 Tax=Stentor coeruleus TaxID=5963 RepID=A0A1R2C178_9CILI|nr:hypothetical protein SteCoe_16451 [Stentor coeruleus]
MKYIAAYALAWLGGKASPSVKDLEGIIKASGSDFDTNKANALVEALKDKSVHELVASGKAKLGGISLGAGATSSAVAGDTKAAPAEAKEEKKETKQEDEDAGMGEGGLGLFGDEEW